LQNSKITKSMKYEICNQDLKSEICNLKSKSFRRVAVSRNALLHKVSQVLRTRGPVHLLGILRDDLLSERKRRVLGLFRFLWLLLGFVHLDQRGPAPGGIV